MDVSLSRTPVIGVPVGDANARRPAPIPAGCPAWARSRQPRHWAWNAAGLVGNDPRHRRPCRRPSPASDRPPREQGTRERSSGAGRRTVGRTDWWDVLELGPGSEQKNSERGMVDWLMGTSKNSRYRSAVTKLPANDSASFPFRFINVHCRVVRDWRREQFFEVP
jgi:hypothetical protein